MPAEWHDLRWTETKKAAQARGLSPPDVKGLDADKRAAAIQTTVESLRAWEKAWGEGVRPAPELLDDEEVAQEAAELGLDLEAGTEPKMLRARVREVHISRQRIATHLSEESDEEEGLEEGPWFDNERGLALTSGCGMSRLRAPLPTRGSPHRDKKSHEVPKEALLPLNKVIVEHRFNSRFLRSLKFYTSGPLHAVMEVKLITGFWHDCRPEAITYEAYSRHTGRRSRITAAALAEMPSHDTPAAS